MLWFSNLDVASDTCKWISSVKGSRDFFNTSILCVFSRLSCWSWNLSFTEYYTGLGSKPILKIVQQSSTGAGTNIIAGLATGMISTFSSVLYSQRPFGLLRFSWILWCCISGLCNDGNNCNAVSN